MVRRDEWCWSEEVSVRFKGLVCEGRPPEEFDHGVLFERGPKRHHALFFGKCARGSLNVALVYDGRLDNKNHSLDNERGDAGPCCDFHTWVVQFLDKV